MEGLLFSFVYTCACDMLVQLYCCSIGQWWYVLVNVLVWIKNIFIPIIFNICLGAQENLFIETVLLSTQSV